MNTLEISNVLKCNKYTNKFFKGVFALDTIPKNIINPSFLIVNTDKKKDPGTHWLVIYVPRYGCIEYFDSYGRIPDKPEIINFLNHKCIVFNSKQLQSSFSEVCGEYCCVYAWYRCLGISMNSFLDEFSKSNHINNDKLILKKFYYIFGKKSTVQSCINEYKY